MVVKFFKPPKHGGSVGAIRYLLSSKRVKNGTAKVLQGDPNITQELILGNKNKQKVDVGCLSFEEPDISEEMKYKLMSEFEEMLMPGMQGRYNILWVQHTDKGRLELNFCIPKIELERKRAITPYLHRVDLPRVETWQNLTNISYGFSDPKNPAKVRTVELNSKITKLNIDYEKLDEIIHDKVQNGDIENREQIITLLRDSGIIISRVGKDYMSVKLPNSTKARRFKGSIYREQFSSLDYIREEFENQQRKIEKFANRNTEKEIARLERKLLQHIGKKRGEIQARYKYSETEKQEDEDVSLLVLNNPSRKFSKLLNPYKPDIIDEDTRNENGKDILHHSSEKENIVMKNRDRNVTYIPFYRYEKDIRAKLEPYYHITRNEWGNVLYCDVKKPEKTIKDKGKELNFHGGEIQRQDIYAMIDICESKGWKIEEIKFDTPDQKAILIFREEREKRLKKAQKEVKIKKNKERVKPDYIEPERIRKEEYYRKEIR